MLTIDEAVSAGHFEHVSLKDSRGEPRKCRRNGATKTWKTRPGLFKIPVKFGLYGYGYITNENAHEWRVA